MTGVILSCTGIILGLFILIYTIFLINTDPEYQKLYNETFEYYSNFYGYDLNEM